MLLNVVVNIVSVIISFLLLCHTGLVQGYLSRSKPEIALMEQLPEEVEYSPWFFD
jgi:hypothetical protein